MSLMTLGLPSLPRLGNPGFEYFPGMRPPRQEQNPLVPPLDPAEEESLLAQIGGSTLSGLAAVGNVLDTPASVVRGLLRGEPGRALGGILDPSQRVYGTELLGMDRSTPLFSWGGAGGLATEIALDPLTYLTLGGSALTKLGKSARAAGVLPKTGGTSARIKGLQAGTPEIQKLEQHTGLAEAELAGKPLGSVAKFLGMNIGTGAGGQRFLDVIGKVNPLGVMGRWEPLAALGRGARGLFDPSVQGTLSKELQPVAAQAFHGANERLPKEMRGLVGQMRQLQDAGVLKESQLLRPLAEGIKPEHYTETTRQLLANMAPEARQVYEQVGLDVRAMMDRMLKEAQSLGGNTKELSDQYAKYLTRHLAVPTKMPKGPQGARPLSTNYPEQMARLDEFRDIPGGSAAIEEMMLSPALRLMPKEDAAQLVREKYLWPGITGSKGKTDSDMLVELEALRSRPDRLDEAATKALEKRAGDLEFALVDNNGFPLSPQRRVQVENELNQVQAALAHENDLLAREQALAGVQMKSGALVGKSKELAPLSDQLASEGMGLWKDPFTDLATALSHHVKATENMDKLHDLFVQFGRHMDDELGDEIGNLTAKADKGYVSLDTAYAMSGMGKMVPDKPFGKANEAALLQFMNRSAKNPQWGTGAFDPKKVQIPRHIAEDASRMMQVLQSPEAMKPWLKLFDQATNLFKAGNTFIWPAYHVRNLFSALSQNMFTGTFSMASLKAAHNLHFGKVIDGAGSFKALKGLNPEQATKAIADTAVAHGLVARDMGPHADVVGGFVKDVMGGQMPRQLPGPGVRQQSVPELLGQGLKGQFTREGANPLNIAGVGSTRDAWAPARAGRQVAQQIDELGTMSAFIELLRRGYDMDAAAQMAKAIHYKGAQFTGFEHGFMRRLVPFYWWMRNNTEFITRQVFERPGGSYAQAYRAGTRARGSEEGFLPPWLGQRAITPLGSPDSTGTQKFMSSLGLPFEDVPELMNMGGVLGSINPMVKAPLELATGKQFFSGRDLADLHPYTGNTLADQAIFNSPLARATGYLRQATDPRKTWMDRGLNFFTGLRITDVDMDKARDIAVRDHITESLRGRPGVKWYQAPYTTRENLESLSPQDFMLLRLQASRRQAFQNRTSGQAQMG